MIRPRTVRGFPPARRPIPPQLIEAHRLFGNGEYQKAAELYLELAGKAHERGIPQAPNLYLRGAAALLKTGAPQGVIEMIQKGLGILIAGERWLQLKKAGTITLDRLKAEGQNGLAAEIKDWLEEQVPERIKGSEAWRRAAHGARSANMKLPATCGQCGGPVHPDEVDWFEGGSAVCSYCGAVLGS